MAVFFGFRSRHLPCGISNNRYAVTLATRGGNQSWNGLVKRFSSSRCEFLFILVGDGRQWFIPAGHVEGGSSIIVGGPKYAAYEIERGRPIEALQTVDR